MHHPIHRVRSVEVVGLYALRVDFEDGTAQTIDLSSVLEGELFGPLRDPHLFKQVRVDSEVGTIIWPNGADFDPATLHDWPIHAKAMTEMAQKWKRGAA